MKNPFYVYALKDPTVNPAMIFYIGKGTGERAWEHEKDTKDSEKTRAIAAIHAAGKEVIHSIMLSDLTEEQAFKIEAELISSFGIRANGGLLTNKVQPNPNTISNRKKMNVPDGIYERAQTGLSLLKSAVWEFAAANESGVTNADTAKYLGLQSNYGGGAKDYLSYSILGLLRDSGDIERLANRKHIAKSYKSNQ